MYFMDEIGLTQNKSLRYLNISVDAFRRLTAKHHVNRILHDGKFIYKFDDLDKIKAELEERKAISSLPSYIPTRMNKWEPSEEHISLIKISDYYKTSKQNICRLVNTSDYKFAKFIDKDKKMYYLKSEICQYFEYKGRKYEE